MSKHWEKWLQLSRLEQAGIIFSVICSVLYSYIKTSQQVTSPYWVLSTVESVNTPQILLGVWGIAFAMGCLLMCVAGVNYVWNGPHKARGGIYVLVSLSVLLAAYYSSKLYKESKFDYYVEMYSHKSVDVELEDHVINGILAKQSISQEELKLLHETSLRRAESYYYAENKIIEYYEADGSIQKYSPSSVVLKLIRIEEEKLTRWKKASEILSRVSTAWLIMIAVSIVTGLLYALKRSRASVGK